MSGDVEYILMQQKKPDSKAPGYSASLDVRSLFALASLGASRRNR